MTDSDTTTFTSSYDISSTEHARRQAVIAGGVNSNVRLAGVPVPLTFERAEGALLWDVDGNEYVDYAGWHGSDDPRPRSPGRRRRGAGGRVDAVSSSPDRTVWRRSSPKRSSAPCRGWRASGSA